jgi:hypothetical protein
VKAFSLFFLLLIAFSFPVDQRGVAMIERPSRGKQYETLTFRFAENLHLENPFDLETNRVELEIRQPDSSMRTLSFFYDGMNENEVEQWEARFSPAQPGLHHCTVRISGMFKEEFDLPVEPNREPRQGGLMLSGKHGVFSYQSGEAFRGIGLNVCWADDYGYYFKKMRAAGINVTRIWMCPWHLSFEWKETGLGRYSLDTARRLDEILSQAQEYGIVVILCMDYHGVATKNRGFFQENKWKESPYNRKNGGPCAGPADLFTSPEAQEFLKKKYKYIVSRFGHSPAILAWEFYNEADLMAGKPIPVNRRHIEMAGYVRSIDAHRRMVSTSSTRQYPEKLVDAFRSPVMDFAMFHDYNSPEIAQHFPDLVEAAVAYYQKPIVIGEFGVEYRGADRTHAVDSQHVGLHNGLWAGWFSETPIVPMSWWWDNYIDPLDLWHEYIILSRFAAAVDFDVDRLEFRMLLPGLQDEEATQSPRCLVRALYAGTQCALWLKHEDYEWSTMTGKKEPDWIGPFTQVLPGLTAGTYLVRWYDPQTGAFLEGSSEAKVGQTGELMLQVPSFSRDLSCLITRSP